MNIDMVLIWVAVIATTIILQESFTEQKTVWDVSYTYTNESMDYIAYGQISLLSFGTKLSWKAAQRFIANDTMEKNGDEVEVFVTILASKKDQTKRLFVPFWKHLSWDS